MEELLTTTASLVQHTLNMKSRRSDRPATDGEPLVALADSNQLQQVLVNLALNARDAMPTSPISQVEFRLAPSACSTADLPAFPQNVPPGDYVVLEVEDHGSRHVAGSAAAGTRSFFHDQGRRPGDRVWASGRVRHHSGSSGFLTIDTLRAPAPALRHLFAAPGPQDDTPISRQGFDAAEVLELETPPNRHILVIDDEEAVTDIIRRFLQIAGHQVTCVSNPPVGVEMLSGTAPWTSPSWT